ncbi:TetR family transcriptional regulator [Pseudomonas avellanae BPIC 631]|nr:TetR family transcriptional regulator [Pseudomonas avellanae BPIC 631]
MADGYERMVDAIQAAQLELGNPVLGCGMGYVNFAQKHPQHFRLMFGMAGVNRALPRLVSSGEATLQLLRQSLRTAWIAKHGSEPEPALLEQRTFLAWSTAHGFASLAIDRKTAEPSVVSAESVLQPMSVFLLTP